MPGKEKQSETIVAHRPQERKMGRKLKDMLSDLPIDRQRRIKAETAQLHGEYLALKRIREALGLTQNRLAEELGVSQVTVAQMEKRHDLLLSTLRRYVEGAGGRLTLTVDLPDQPPITLSGLGDVMFGEERHKSG
jgi:DNA-binding XRE family transcriptional regulator